MEEIKQIEFSKLRHAYITVKNFIENESADDLESLKTKIVNDLGLTGDDNYFMLTKFVGKFELEYSDFEYDKHFHSEAELYDSSAALYNLLVVSVWLPLKTIELLTLNMIRIPKPSFYQPARQVSDMTFRDLLTWYIEGKYIPERNVRYAIRQGL
ncbi:hypothetical protein HDC92_000009 [Pedobacter sp. AK017]|uniref:DUF1493 family protein n=1 Tax=Pedobacter sp. AK017 TaxID=2723073 RepID=UPI00161A928B|nr:DUF1493 family protein [Pedobacter sp. AK017]MBB5436345.1 hypothetical protein [Pedobacter sp. AK017]